MKTVQEVFDTLDDDQKKLLYFMVGEATREKNRQIKALKKTNAELNDKINEYGAKEDE